jgi:hypothetical protein
LAPVRAEEICDVVGAFGAKATDEGLGPAASNGTSLEGIESVLSMCLPHCVHVLGPNSGDDLPSLVVVNDEVEAELSVEISCVVVGVASEVGDKGPGAGAIVAGVNVSETGGIYFPC